MPAFRLFQPWLSKTKPPLNAQVNRGHPICTQQKILIPFNEQKPNGVGGDFYTNYADEHYPAWNGHAGQALTVGTVSQADVHGTGDIGCLVPVVSATPWLDFTQMGAPSIIHGLGAFTVAIRAQGDILHTSQPGQIFSGEDNSGNQQDFSLRCNQGSQLWEASVVTGGGPTTINTAQTGQGIYDDVATTFDGSNLRLYKNGTLAVSGAAVGTTTSLSTHLLLMGSTRNNANAEYLGVLVYVMFWTRVLSLHEIQSLVATPYQMFSITTTRALFAAGSASGGGGGTTAPFAIGFWGQ